MELFERIKEVSELVGSATKLASRLSVAQTTFNGYLNAKRQDNLWPLLPKILELFPDLSRDWLYFGEGEMLSTDQQTLGYPLRRAASAASVVSLRAKTLGQNTPELSEKLEQRVAELERENIELKKENAELTVELRGALKELRQLNEEKRGLEERLRAPLVFLENEGNPQHATSVRPATGVPGGGILGSCNKN